MSTAAQITANRTNAHLSTGPTSETGKAKSSLNAVDEAAPLSEPKIQRRCGLTGRTVLLPGDDASAYEALVTQFMNRHQPATDDERRLVQCLADTEWRLMRIPALEMGIYAVGRLEFAELFASEEEAVRNQLIDATVFLAYQRQLNNLSIQEGRLRRQREKDSAALTQLQENRNRERKALLTDAAKQYIEAVHNGTYQDFDPLEHERKGRMVPVVRDSKDGFEFSLAEIEVHAVTIDPQLFEDCEELSEAA